MLADDHGILRDGVRRALDAEPGMKVVAEVSNGLDAVAAAHTLLPDLILMDISMPGMSGIDATRCINDQLPTVSVLCVSMHSDRVFVTAALEAGALGYVLKESPIDRLIEAILAVEQGEIYLDPALAELPDPEIEASKIYLTDRERQVLKLIAKGLSGKRIALRLGVSPKKVSTHRQSMMDKLGIHDVAKVTQYAIEHGWVALDPSDDSSD